MSHHIGKNSPDAPPGIQEVIRKYVAALSGEDANSIVTHYAEDAVIVTQTGLVEGRAAIRDLIARAARDVHNGTFEVAKEISKDTYVLGWTDHAKMAGGADGVDTFVFKGDAIRTHMTGFDIGPSA